MAEIEMLEATPIVFSPESRFPPGAGEERGVEVLER
jgi:hypothetical protein